MSCNFCPDFEAALAPFPTCRSVRSLPRLPLRVGALAARRAPRRPWNQPTKPLHRASHPGQGRGDHVLSDRSGAILPNGPTNPEVVVRVWHGPGLSQRSTAFKL